MPDLYHRIDSHRSRPGHAERRFAFTVRSRSVTVRAIGFGCWDRTMGQLRLAAVAASAELTTGADLPGGARNIRRDDISGMPVQAAPGPVVPHRSSGISVRGGLLHVA